MNPCACGCGSLVKGEWKRGHAARQLRQSPSTGPRPAPVAAPIFSEGHQVPQSWWDEEVDQDDEPENGTGDLDRDPPPSYAAVDSSSSGDLVTGPVTAAQKRDLAGKLGLFFMIPYQGLSMMDPYCSEALAKSMRPMIKALVPIIAGSPEAMKIFAKGGPWLAWLNVGVAAKPLMEAVFAHHISHKVQTVRDENGQKMIVETDYSQYAA